MNADQKVFTLPDVARRAGIEYRTAHMWMKSGLLTPSLRAAEGSGHPALFSEQDALRASRMARLRRAGLSVEGLHLVATDARVLRDMLTEWIRVENAARRKINGGDA